MDFVNQSCWGVAITFSILFLSLLIGKVSPLKNSIILLGFSLLVGVVLYKNFLSLFPCGGVLISYSSGMMIIFCYCSMMVEFDFKSNSYSLMGLVLCYFCSLLFYETSSFYFSYSISFPVFLGGPFIILGMCMVILSMLSINLSMFDPKKSLFYSY